VCVVCVCEDFGGLKSCRPCRLVLHSMVYSQSMKRILFINQLRGVRWVLLVRMLDLVLALNNAVM
jgi:hypothetical protein